MWGARAFVALVSSVMYALVATAPEARANTSIPTVAAGVVPGVNESGPAGSPDVERSSADSKIRDRIVERATGLVGIRYRYGGIDPAGFDCSGLVVYVFADTAGMALPRTALELASHALPIPRDFLERGDLVFFGPAGTPNHVGIYVGGNRFVHAVSDIAEPSVIISVLTDPHWSGMYISSGRVLPRPPGSARRGVGIPVSLFVALAWDGPIAGAGMSFGISLPVLGGSAGIDVRAEYDATLGIVRFPVLLNASPDDRLRFFIGPAATFGSPGLDLGGTVRRYRAIPGIGSTLGVSWIPASFRLGSSTVGLIAEIERRSLASEDAPDAGYDARARWRFNLGLRFR